MSQIIQDAGKFATVYPIPLPWKKAGCFILTYFPHNTKTLLIVWPSSSHIYLYLVLYKFFLILLESFDYSLETKQRKREKFTNYFESYMVNIAVTINDRQHLKSVHPALIIAHRKNTATKMTKWQVNLILVERRKKLKAKFSFLSRCSQVWCRSRRFDCILLVFFRRWGQLVMRDLIKHDALLWLVVFHQLWSVHFNSCCFTQWFAPSAVRCRTALLLLCFLNVIHHDE